jgi:DUF1009 family protein
MSDARPADAPGGVPLVVIAAGGAVPFEVASAATAAGRKLLVVALEGEYDQRLRQFPLAVVKWGQIGRVKQLIAQHGARELVFIGAVNARPDFANLGLDLGTLRLMPRILKGMIGGDDTVLGNLVKIFEEDGPRVVGAHEVAPDLVARPGLIGGPRPGTAAMADAAVALDAAKAIGALDIGQAAVAVNRRVIALEAAEGTDAMLERVAQVRAQGRAKWNGRAGVLAKRSKPQQDLRVDMPTIGERTVRAAAAAGLAGIAIEAGRVMIVDRPAVVALADKEGLFIVGRDAGEGRPKR